jgi:putative membrane protein
MHHVGPMLIALAWPGATLRRGMPPALFPLSDNRLVAGVFRVTQGPMIAAILFVGLFWFWLIPPVHFRAMLDPQLYALMNWTMVADGVMFWCVVLDPRPKPPASASGPVRVGLALAVMFPQILLGALITFAGVDLYPYYDLCGRLIPSIGAIDDQQLGGLVIWIPPAMMSVIATLLALNSIRLREASRKDHTDAQGPHA